MSLEVGDAARGACRGSLVGRVIVGLMCVAAGAASAASTASTASAERVGTCRFSRESLQFEGSALEQAACLLRPVAMYGKVAAAKAVLPASLAGAIGQPVDIDKPRLRQHLAALGLSESQVGGSLDQALSQANAGSAAASRARYFVMHDTSAPWLGEARSFPPDATPALNDLARYGGANAVAHVFVNRLGATLLGHDFAVPWRATKLESQTIGAPARGLFLHIELLQPRRRDPAGGAKNDAIAPDPGFTKAQYETLALLYVAASVRRGEWLIPGFHAAIDEGLADAHDDPQHFVLDDFAAAVAALRQGLSALPTTGGAAPVAPSSR